MYVCMYVCVTLLLCVGPIETALAVADLMGDGTLAIIVTDMSGNVAAVTADGEVLWDAQLPSTGAAADRAGVNSIPYSAVVADVDGDGQLDVVLASVERHSSAAGTAPGGSGSGSGQGTNGTETGGRSGGNSTRTRTRSHPRQRRHPGSGRGGGCIWVYNGATGVLLPGYPIHLPQGAVISGSVTVMDLHTRSVRVCVVCGPWFDC